MSNRTIMEFNHDFGGDIEDKPEEFLELLGAVLRGLDREAKERLQYRYGVTVGRTRVTIRRPCRQRFARNSVASNLSHHSPE